jgi:hypothetical protein
MQVEGTVLARNKMAGPTVISSDPRSTHFVQWEGAGDPSGGDVQLVPKEIENPEDNPALMETLSRQSETWAKRQSDLQTDIRSTIESQPNRDLITLGCIGPAPRGAGLCNAEVTVRDVTKYDAPALCHQHISLASQYVSDDQGRDDKGNKVTSWTRVTGL